MSLELKIEVISGLHIPPVHSIDSNFYTAELIDSQNSLPVPQFCGYLDTYYKKTTFLFSESLKNNSLSLIREAKGKPIKISFDEKIPLKTQVKIISLLYKEGITLN